MNEKQVEEYELTVIYKDGSREVFGHEEVIRMIREINRESNMKGALSVFQKQS